MIRHGYCRQVGSIAIDEDLHMPAKSTIQRAQRDKRAGKSASTQAGEFVHDEIERIRGGEHGAKNAKQAIAIGLSEARRAGVDIPDKRGSKAKPKRKAASRTRSASPRKSTRSATTRKSTRSASPRKSTRSAAPRKSTRKSAAKKAAPRRSASKRSASGTRTTTSRRRSQATLRALKRMPRRAASHLALSRQAHS